MEDEEHQSERDSLLDEGERCFYDGRYEDALARFEQAIALDPDDADAHYLKGRALFYMGRDDDSLSAFDRALDLEPEFIAAVIHKAELLVRALGWPEEALDLLDQGEELGMTREDRVDAAFVRGLAHMERGEFREALEHLNRAVRGDQEWAEARRERGICRFYMWRFEDAARDIEAALRSDSNDAEAHYFLAMCLERTGRTREAEEHYRLASDLDPQAYHMPLRVPRREFEKAAEQALQELPEEFRVRFDNIIFSVEDFPARDPNILPDLLGLFQGTNLPDRPGAIYLEPARVLLFQKNLERYASDIETLKDEIGKTVLHEVGHYFGLAEDDMVRLNIH